MINERKQSLCLVNEKVKMKEKENVDKLETIFLLLINRRIYILI